MKVKQIWKCMILTALIIGLVVGMKAMTQAKEIGSSSLGFTMNPAQLWLLVMLQLIGLSLATYYLKKKAVSHS